MMRLFLIVLLCLLCSNLAQAQANTNAYEIALAEIEAARISGATQLDLRRLGLSTLPPEIGSLHQLEDLMLASNQLTSLPPEIGNLTELQWLELDYNQLTSLPPEIGNLSKLRSLFVSYNQLGSLPPEIGNLGALVQLRAGDNELSDLPPEIGDLPLLNMLLLYQNNLQSLPDTIGQLANLCTLDLSENQLLSLPASLVSITPLNHSDRCELDISNNPLSPHRLIQDEGSLSIINYIANPKLWIIRRYLLVSCFWISFVFAAYFWLRPANKWLRKAFFSSAWSLLAMSALYGFAVYAGVFWRITLLYPAFLVLGYPLLPLIYILWHNLRHGFKPVSVLLVPAIIFSSIMVFGYFFECRAATDAWLIGTPFWFNIRCM